MQSCPSPRGDARHPIGTVITDQVALLHYMFLFAILASCCLASRCFSPSLWRRARASRRLARRIELLLAIAFSTAMSGLALEVYTYMLYIRYTAFACMLVGVRFLVFVADTVVALRICILFLHQEAPTAPLSALERWPEPAAAPSPKERYTEYYRDACRVGCCDEDRGDDAGDEDDDREDDAEEHDGDGGVYRTPSVMTTTTDPFGWEVEVVRSLSLTPTVAEMRLGPGRYRSPTALGGSVVQLWDQVAGGGLTPTASPRRRGRVVAAAPGF
ncbi:hypothetical protein C2845_PM09G06180 [Panicum miliaceum]|uniref:Uncharacterized protein n=1 Tax=Panicum miliaceum TaxID=4540 RepID=A0A3L6RZM8_PANMI|nr:hypothetical protein C2845_PM09G06180 [Panicum miliaceum]